MDWTDLAQDAEDNESIILLDIVSCRPITR
jgi:hypothetical protein